MPLSTVTEHGTGAPESPIARRFTAFTVRTRACRSSLRSTSVEPVLVGAPDHRVEVPDSAPVLGSRGPLRDRPLARQACHGSSAVSLPPLLGRLAQVPMQRSASPAVLPHIAVDRLVADRQSPSRLNRPATCSGLHCSPRHASTSSQSAERTARYAAIGPSPAREVVGRRRPVPPSFLEFRLNSRLIVLGCRPRALAIAPCVKPCLRSVDSAYRSSEVSWWYFLIESSLFLVGKEPWAPADPARSPGRRTVALTL